MPITHDGISCPLPMNPVSVGVGIALGCGAAALAYLAYYVPAVGLAVVGLIVLVNQYGTRRIRVISSKLVVEDERLLRNLLIGPARSRVEWKQVRAVRIDGSRLVLETSGAPFVTGQGAAREDLEALKLRVDAAIAKERAGG
ncbi:MAG: hypothetical protein Q8P18_18660 [Pseudomonadota bacterium]|nr:hypothetical protein [Pseudomonadota bacterium]